MSNKSKGGFRRKKPTITIKFGPDHDLHGFEVTVKPASIDLYLNMLQFTEMTEGASGQRVVAGATNLCELLGAQLLAWNLEDDDGDPILCNVESLREQDTEFVMQLVAAWFDAVRGVPAPLDSDSPSGDQSQALSDLTELSSLSQPNSDEPS